MRLEPEMEVRKVRFPWARIGTPSLTALAATFACLATGVLAPVPASASAISPNSLAPSVLYVACPDGATSVVTTPANGFNPLTATDAQLLANNLPPRPATGSTEPLSVWQRFVTTYRSKADCTPATDGQTTGLQGPHSALQPLSPSERVAGTGALAAAGDVHSANWAGNIATGTYWNDAYGTFQIQVPEAPASSCAYSVQWVGIGQGKNSTYPLVQAGSKDNACYGRSDQTIALWWEQVWNGGGNGSQTVYSGAHAGDYIWVHINVPNDCGRPTMTIEDDTTLWGASYEGPWTACSDGTAEWILERPDLNNTYPMLANASVQFWDATVGGPGVVDAGVGNVPHYLNTMWDCTNGPDYRLAYPGPITSGGTSELQQYENIWQNYGVATTIPDCTVG